MNAFIRGTETEWYSIRGTSLISWENATVRLWVFTFTQECPETQRKGALGIVPPDARRNVLKVRHPDETTVEVWYRENKVVNAAA